MRIDVSFPTHVTTASTEQNSKSYPWRRPSDKLRGPCPLSPPVNLRQPYINLTETARFLTASSRLRR